MRVTLKHVAQEAGTSVAAVSATLVGKRSGSTRVGEQTREKIVQAAARLGYVPNPIARSLSTGRTGVLGLVFPYLDAFVDRNPFCSLLMSGVFSEAIEDRYNMMLYTARDGYWNRGQSIDPRVDGLILALPDPSDPILRQCVAHQFPCVAIVTEPQDGIITVNADDKRGGYLATRHLIELGHTNIMMLHGGDTISSNRHRLNGYNQALAEANIEPREDLLVKAGFDWRPAKQAMEAVLQKPSSTWPTAIFAVNDLCAAGAMLALQERGLRIPDDIAIVGFDDTQFSTSVQPALTTVKMPITKMGATAAQMLAKEVEGHRPTERHVTLEVSLTIRQSCGAKTATTTPDFAYQEPLI